ncbi:MAG: hypothetical protein GXY51_10575 [Bacteroidetes bacterium]|jgi:hypothetical protein|nr:hypothetical protein [Bacteroidota bacterium]
MNNLVDFCDMVFYGKQLTPRQKAKFYSNPYFPTFREYYGGLEKMMPWINDVPHK